ncbi:MAG: PGPGW domain-containing protein, partial [Actinomycetota bacterium]|nr:PGPGW domain-containing protein [Actinomycetota bacterium]
MGDPTATDPPVESPDEPAVRRHGRRLAVGIVGGLVVLVGLVLMPLPGPGLLVVLAGLAILASEFAPAAAALH